MRTGLLHYSCPPVIGGVEEVMGQQAQALNEFGHDVFILAGTGGRREKKIAEGSKDRVETRIETRIEPLISSRNKKVEAAHKNLKKGDPTLIRQLTLEILEILLDWSENLDVILAHNVLNMPFNLPLTLALRRLAHKKGSPALISWAHDSPFFHDSYPDHLDNTPWNVLKKNHPRIKNITISEARVNEFEKLTGESWKIIRNGIDPGRLFYLKPGSLSIFKKLNLYERDLVILQPARITPRKGIEFSIHIIYQLKKMGLDVLLMLTGAYDPHDSRAPAYYRRLKYWIDELGLGSNIVLLAEIMSDDGKNRAPDRRTIRDMYISSDLLLMTSTDEGFGLPLLEAGLLKLPMAVSDIPAFKEIGEDICLFSHKDPPKDIARKILEYLDEVKTHHMFRHVMQNYLWEGIIKNELIPYLEEIK